MGSDLAKKMTAIMGNKKPQAWERKGLGGELPGKALLLK